MEATAVDYAALHSLLMAGYRVDLDVVFIDLRQDPT